MVKYLINFSFVFLMLSSFSLAKDDDSKLKNEFGPELTKAPFFLRFDFQRRFGVDWNKSNYAERKDFLINYETDLAQENAKEKLEAKAEADEQKKHSREKKEVLRKEKERLKAREAEERAEDQDNYRRQKQFNDLIRDQQKELKHPSQGGESSAPQDTGAGAQDTGGTGY